MHNLRTICETTRQAVKEYLADKKNFEPHPIKPGIHDAEVINAVITKECLEIDSKNLLFRILHSDHKKFFPNLILGVRYNYTKKRLEEGIKYCVDFWSKELNPNDNAFIINSMWISTCKMRHVLYPITKHYLIWYKLYIIVFLVGIYIIQTILAHYEWK